MIDLSRVARFWVVTLLACNSGTGAEDDGGGGGEDVPSNEYCATVADWDPAWAQFETEVLALVNARRSQGADCGNEGSFGVADALEMNPALRCAARKHSMDMAVRNFFDHVNPDGEAPWDRMDRAGYSWNAAGENIAGGADTPETVMAGWMESDGHCANIMSANFADIGVGYHSGSGMWGTYWTQTFGAT